MSPRDIVFDCVRLNSSAVERSHAKATVVVHRLVVHHPNVFSDFFLTHVESTTGQKQGEQQFDGRLCNAGHAAFLRFLAKTQLRPDSMIGLEPSFGHTDAWHEPRRARDWWLVSKTHTSE